MNKQIDIKQVAERWGISSRSVYRMIETGILPAKTTARPIPVYSYSVDGYLVDKVEKALQLQGKQSPRKIKKLIKENLHDVKSNKN